MTSHRQRGGFPEDHGINENVCGDWRERRDKF